MRNAALKQFSLEVKDWLVLIIGSLSWSLTIIKSGLFYDRLGVNGPGLGFWGANGHDGIWHIALTESLLKSGFSQMPVFAGSALQNYHTGFDWLLAFIHVLTRIPVDKLYFQILPPLTAILIGLLVFVLIYRLTGSKSSARWGLFFVYFGGSLSWILGKGESAFWSQQAISTLINPPFSLSLVLMLLGLIGIMDRRIMLPVLAFGILIAVKVYGGVLAIGALFVCSVYDYVYKKDSYVAKIFLGTLLTSLIIFFTLEKGSQNLLTIGPFWYLETLMGLTDRLNWERYYSAMTNYRASHNFVKLIPAYFFAFVIFILGNLGTRAIFLFRRLTLNTERIFMYAVIVGGVLLPMVFLQKGTPWNTIQFFYYSLFFSSILAGIAIGKIKNIYITFLIILSTLPTSLLALKDVYIPGRPPAMLPQVELAALKFLSKQPYGIVLTKPFNEEKAKEAESNPPRPLYLYTSTAYVAAYSKHPTFMEDQINLDITGYPWQERNLQIMQWYVSDSNSDKTSFLKNNNITYIYWLKEGQSPLDIEGLGIENIFENEKVTIYKVK